MNNQSEIIARALLGVSETDYGNCYREHLLTQYLKYLDMADKISDRRSAANTFFLTVNTALISSIGIANLVSQMRSPFFFAIVGFAAILLCYFWYRLIRSYKDLNTAKFRVIHELEKHVPIRLFEAEWESVGRGKNKKLYLPFTHIEMYVPWIFILLYSSLILYVVI